jgi:intracellular septation protein A
MILKNKNIRRILIRILIAFAIVAIVEYLVINLLSSKPVIMLKVQGIIGVSIIAFLIHSCYKIWVIYNLDHPISENGDQ